jgi:gamma-glutamyltranspeptidase/glutathione hydrolase
MINLLEAQDLKLFDLNSPERLHRMTQAMRQAFADRFTYLADPDRVEVPLAILADPEYAREQAAKFGDDQLGPIRAGDPTRMGVSHGMAASMPEYVRAPNQMANGSTTHLGVIDRDGVAVSLTQTLLSGWGSRVVVPGTGVLLNNGMMWFDPEPGRPNSVEGGKRPLSNMAPAIVSRDGTVVASIGSSGGRRIMGCNAQLALNLVDHQMSMQPAINAPRIDASTPELLVSARVAPSTVAVLAARGHQVGVRDERLFTGDFASPAGILIDGDGVFHGGADPYYMPAAAIGVEPVGEK